MPHKNKCSLISRMNFNTCHDIIYFLEDNYTLETSEITEVLYSQNEVSDFLNRIIVRYQISNEIKEKICLIKNLKKQFDFIKIIYNTSNNFIIFMVLKNRKYSKYDILKKINDKNILGEEIKNNLNIDEFPLVYYILEEIYTNEPDEFESYNQLYILKHYKEKKIINYINKIENNNGINNFVNNIVNYNFINNNDKIKEKIKELENLVDKVGKNIDKNLSDKCNELNDKLSYIQYKLNSLVYKDIELYFINKLNNSNNLLNNINNYQNFHSFPFQRQVNIYCKSKNKYISMVNDGKIIEDIKPYTWDVKIKFSDKTISFYSKKYYIKEINGNIIGYKGETIWNFDILDNSIYYFINKEKATNNILSMQDLELKANKPIPGDNEKFKLIDINENVKMENSLFSSEISDKLEEKNPPISLYSSSS